MAVPFYLEVTDADLYQEGELQRGSVDEPPCKSE